ncbi:MAG: SM-20-related protein [Candidatus Azotimanducaceae bacterium]|jgi:SM-20-related protein
MTYDAPLALAPDLASHPWQQTFASSGRVHIPDILSAQSADRIFACLDAQSAWNLVCQQNGQHIDLNADIETTWSAEQRSDFMSELHRQANDSFQYLYKAIPLYDVYHEKRLPNHFLNQVFEFINSKPVLDYLRITLNLPDIGFADAQVTCYTQGHFLTQHDDDVPGKNRLAGYVLNLTPVWSSNWGGALQFYDGTGNCINTMQPSYNALNVFQVPQPHAVTYVPPFASGKRFAITGWLRAGQDPAVRTDP